MNERKTLKVNEKGHLEIGGADTVELAKQFGTPLYVMDEDYIRNMCRLYVYLLERALFCMPPRLFPVRPSIKIAASEGIGVDVVSGGELYTAIKAGFPAEKICLHGNNKLQSELQLALDYGVGRIVVDSVQELDTLDSMCAERGTKQAILLRINPGVEAHTHHYIQTAKTDSKFGFSIADGTAEEMTSKALEKKNLLLEGYHCHIGSQIFEKQSFALAAEKMIAFMAAMHDRFSFEARSLNLGGGYGIWYTDEDRKISCPEYAEYLRTILRTIEEKSKEAGPAAAPSHDRARADPL